MDQGVLTNYIFLYLGPPKIKFLGYSFYWLKIVLGHIKEKLMETEANESPHYGLLIDSVIKVGLKPGTKSFKIYSLFVTKSTVKKIGVPSKKHLL